MFDGILDKFQSLQDNLTTTLRGLSVNDPLNKRQTVKQNQTVNLNAGTDILDQFQISWSELHKGAQLNATKADELDKCIKNLQKNIEKKCLDFSQMTNFLISLPEIVYSLNELSEKIIIIEELFDCVEKSLIQLEDIIDTRHFQNKQLEQRFQLAMYKEKKLASLENLQFSITEKLRKEEERQLLLLKESEEILKRDSKYYQETSISPKIEFTKSENVSTNEIQSRKLEDITLECEDTNALDEFLNNTERSDKNLDKQ